MSYEIRKLGVQDVALYKKIRLHAFLESPSSFSESFEDECNYPESYFLNCLGMEALWSKVI